MKTNEQLVGKKFSMLMVLAVADPDHTGKKRWLCRCDCGEEKIIYEQSFCRGATKSCGCLNKALSRNRMSEGWSTIITKEYLTKHHLEEKLSLRQIAKNLGCTLGCVVRYMDKFDLQANEATYDLVGSRFDRLIVDSFSHMQKSNSYWNVICDCGTTKVVQGKSLVRKKVVSCGCWNKEKCWKGCGDLSMTYWSKLQSGANKRGLDFLIPIEEGWELFEKQGHLCALSGIPLVLDRSYGTHKRKFDVLQTASLDRIDSKKGYIENNVQWIDVRINRMKMDLDETEFKNLCRAVADYGSGNTILSQEAKCSKQ